MARPAFALLFTLSTVAHANPPPSDPIPQKTGLSLTLAVKKPLHLVRQSKSVTLDGALEVTLTNAGPSTIRLVPKHEIHGLLFTPKSGGAPFVVVHDCQCLHDAQSDRWDSYGVVKNAARKITLDQWSCEAGPFPTPPPGHYTVTYRTLVYPDPIPPSPKPDKTPPKELLTRCRAELTTENYWKNSLISNAIDVTLDEPKAPVKPRRRPRHN